MTSAGKSVVVVGAGIVGLSSACRLAEIGYDVTVVEQAAVPAAMTSHANAGQLLFDRIGAMGSPGFLRALPCMLVNADQGVRAVGLGRPRHWPWAVAFLRQCTEVAWRRNTIDLLKIAHLSRNSMHDFMTRHAITFDWRKAGKLILHATEADLAAARRSAEFQGRSGGVHQILTREACLNREPALRESRRPFVGAIHLPDAEVGDCNLCCQELARILVQDLGGTIRVETQVKSLIRNGGRVIGLRTDGETIGGDIFVVATGNAAHSLLRRRFQGSKPVVGVVGISLTYHATATAPNLSVTDASGKFVMARLGDRIRVTGNAVFSNEVRAGRSDVERLMHKAQTLMPQAAVFDEMPEIWAGARPQTPDDLPMIGRADASNLFVNAGHGSLGWTLAFGSAELLLRHIAFFTTGE